MTTGATPGDQLSLTLPLPTALPSSISDVSTRISGLLRDIPGDHFEALQFQNTAVREELIDWMSGHLDTGAVPRDSSPAACEVHDDFFVVRRADGDAASLLAGAILLSDLVVRRDLATHGTTVDSDPDGMLLGVSGFLTGTPVPAGKDLDWRADDPAAAANHRWLAGHQRFFVLMQLLVVAVKQLRDRPDSPAVRDFAWLCRSSAHAMRYAADFPPELYGEVRDTMAPPAVNAGFSGLQTRDHRELVAQFRKLKQDGVMARLGEHGAGAVREAVREMYDAHLWVCDRFGGSTEQSLLMEQLGGKHETGLESAEKLACQRLAAFDRN
ncbi:hypothetical protein [Lentzea sp. NPDC059081]|uniref:hypothetical protein n=1 Tax=Lentzea sp. NPDC059081 TaxID=3346719 RepID=UPI0036D0636A